MTTLESLIQQKYINVTTFRKNGKAVPTPVWFVARDDKLYSFTFASSGKVKRISANGRAQIAPSDWRGNPLSEFISARARIIPMEDPLWKEIKPLYEKKYGLQYRLYQWAERLFGNPKEKQVILEFEVEP
jgi:PPOX class probable F420-dependent enzyme